MMNRSKARQQRVRQQQQQQRLSRRNVLVRGCAGVLLPLLMAGLLLLAQPDTASAARGGRIGGGSFAPRSFPSRSPGRSNLGGGYNGGYNRGFGGGFGFPFIIPFFGFGGGGLFGLLILMAVVGMLVNGLRGAMAGSAAMTDDGTDFPQSYRDGPVTIAQMQLGLLADARRLQLDLRQLAAQADTSTASGLQRLLQDTILALLRSPEYWVYANTEVGQVPFPAAEATFNRLSMAERGKLDGETTSNFDGQRSSNGAGQMSAASDYIAVTILVASRSALKLPAPASAEALREALRLLGSVPSADLMSLEVIWQPDGADDTLDANELVTLYPQLQRL